MDGAVARPNSGPPRANRSKLAASVVPARKHVVVLCRATCDAQLRGAQTASSSSG